MVSELDVLIGSEVSGVAFVRDYVELHFDGPILRVLSGPIVEVGAERCAFPEAGSVGLLRELIGRRVTSARETADELQVAFERDAELRVPLISADSGEEAAHLVPFLNGRLDVANMSIWESQAP
jgi:hypothetical protein